MVISAKRPLKAALIWAVALGLALSVSACGRKGDLEPPTQSQS